jgi:hypothetical protein
MARNFIRCLHHHYSYKHAEVLGACTSSYVDSIGSQLGELARRIGGPSAASSCSRDVHTFTFAGGMHALGGDLSLETTEKAAICGTGRARSWIQTAGLGVLQPRRTMVLGFGDGDEDKDFARHHQEQRVIG